MRKLIVLTLLTAFFSNLSFAQLSKDEKKRLREELKIYMSDLEAYNSKKQDITTTLDSNAAEIKRLKDELAYSTIKQSELQDKASAYEREITRVQTENDQLRNYYYGDSIMVAQKIAAAKALKDYEDANNKPAGDAGNTTEAAGSDNAPAAAVTPNGTLYKVQIGLYKGFNITKYFEQAKSIGYENVNGMNRYIISSFADEKTAKSFVEDVRRMGIRDAFVAKYTNGKRVYEWNNSTAKTSPELKEQLDNGGN